MIITTKVSMDLQRPGFPAVVYAVQGDRDTRCLEMVLYSGGTALDIPAGTVVSMRYAKPDGTRGYYDTMPDGQTAYSISGNTVRMLLAPQMLTVPGAVSAQLELLQGTKTLGTFSIVVHVEADPAAGVLESEDYINWLQWMEQEFQERVQELLKDGDLKGDPGPKGDPGENAVLTGFSVAYQESESGEEYPTGEWLETVPFVAQGNYLWTRTVYTFNTGEPVTQYSVARFGIDGSGAVSSVAGISPDAEGNVPLDASHVKALPIGGGDMEGPINMNGQTLSGLNAPVKATEPVTKGYAEENYASKQFVEEYAAPPKAGFIYPLASAVIPDGFLLCDGASYSRTEYPELFAAIGTMYGEGDGATTFNVPDIVERVPAGAGENHPVGQMVGEETHQLTVDEMPSHNHRTTDGGGSGNLYYTEGTNNIWLQSRGNTSSPYTDYTGTAGGSQPHNIMQPTTYIRAYIIATGKGSGVSVSDIVMGAQALPLEVQYGGTGATNAADARKNLGLGAVNLTDNSDFTHFVAQAGIGGKHGTQAYAGDRWILDSGTVTGDANENGNGYRNIKLNGTIRQIIAAPPEVGTVFVEMVSGTAEVSYANGEVTIISAGGVIKNAVLYEGSYTSENMPKYQPKGYGAEMAECQRYFQKINSYIYAMCVYDDGSNIDIQIPLATALRSGGAIPTVSANFEGVTDWTVSVVSYVAARLRCPKQKLVNKTSGSLLSSNENGYISKDL